jgi:ABC-type uncharacterized transport system permease subunit
MLEKFVSEKTVLLWIISTFSFTLVLALLGGLIILGIDGCWPIGSSHAASNCLSGIEPGFLSFMPSILGAIAGTVWTIRERKVP